MTAAILTAGVLASFSLLVVGVLLCIVTEQPVAASALRPFQLHAADPAAMIIHLGVLILMVTPIARVASLAVEFYRKKERAFLLISLGVLLLLFSSIYIGRSAL